MHKRFLGLKTIDCQLVLFPLVADETKNTAFREYILIFRIDTDTENVITCVVIITLFYTFISAYFWLMSFRGEGGLHRRLRVRTPALLEFTNAVPKHEARLGVAYQARRDGYYLQTSYEYIRSCPSPVMPMH